MVLAMKLTALGLLLLGSAALAGSEDRIDAYLAKGDKALAAAHEVLGAALIENGDNAAMAASTVS